VAFGHANVRGQAVEHCLVSRPRVRTLGTLAALLQTHVQHLERLQIPHHCVSDTGGAGGRCSIAELVSAASVAGGEDVSGALALCQRLITTGWLAAQRAR
jgi:hypothetical protein